jgi:gamma-glutamylcyclotransferase (GGCT)/AIG2-like uncharacterized protein YtfP
MCLIIHKPKGKRIPREYLNNAMVINPDGFGVTYVDTGDTFRSLSYDKVEEMLDTDRELVCHFRFATVGKVNEANIHPFEIDDDRVIYSNGTINGYGATDCSDIKDVATNVLAKLPVSKWVQFLQRTDTRFAIVNTNKSKVVRINHWHKRDGIYYSKANCFARHRVAVYGTLKHRYGNHRLLEQATFVGDGTTKGCYPLEVSGLPYLHDYEGLGHNVQVEVYDVDDATMRSLDSLEGNPTFYYRRRIDVAMDDWSTAQAWVYFIKNRSLPSEEAWTDSYVGREFYSAFDMSDDTYVYR